MSDCHPVFRSAALALVLALAGCAATPVVQPRATPIAAMPYEVAAEPERYMGGTVVWGGMILKTENLEDHTEISILGYPLDDGQRPLIRAPTQGRFIVVLPGYVESYDYPQGRYLTLEGGLAGTRVGQVEQHEYVFPLVHAGRVHVWPNGFQFDSGPRWHFGVGVGVRL